MQLQAAVQSHTKTLPMPHGAPTAMFPVVLFKSQLYLSHSRTQYSNSKGVLPLDGGGPLARSQPPHTLCNTNGLCCGLSTDTIGSSNAELLRVRAV